MNPEERTITPEDIETLENLYKIEIETDEDYQKLGEIFDEDE